MIPKVKIDPYRLMYLSMASFVFVASFALSIDKLNSLRNPKIVTINDSLEFRKYPSIPIISNKNEHPEFSAEAVLAVDANSGVILFSKNPDLRVYPASTTKMITALTAMDYYDLDRVIKVGNVNVVGQKMKLLPGESISVRDLISGLLIFSANDAAEVLAQNYCVTNASEECGRDYFIDAMNQKAMEIHLDNTTFLNPTGLDNEGHLSTARDLSRIALEGMKNPLFRELVGTKEVDVESVDGVVKHKLSNLNELLGEVEGVLGVKTGWTENAKENLVTLIERDDRDVVIVVLGSDDRFGETKTLIDWVFTSYDWKDVNVGLL